MSVKCHSCGEQFNTYGELALHILANKKGHRKGRRWAAKYVMMRGLSPDKRNGKQLNRVALTEEERINKSSTERELSGESELETIRCPHCKRLVEAYIPVEHVDNEHAWRKEGRLSILCEGCR